MKTLKENIEAGGIEDGVEAGGFEEDGEVYYRCRVSKMGKKAHGGEDGKFYKWRRRS